MMDWFTLFCYSLCTAMLTLTVLGLGVSVFMPGMNRWNRRFFTALFTVLLLLMGAFLVDLIVYEFRDMALAEQIDVYFQYLLVSLPMPMFTGYLLHFCGEDLRKSTLFRLVIGLWGIYSRFLASVAGGSHCCDYASQPGRRDSQAEKTA